MATDTIVLSAPTMEPTAPAVSSAGTPSSAPPSSASSSSSGAPAPSSTVDPSKYAIREEYAAALLQEKLAAIPAADESPVEIDGEAIESGDSGASTPEEGDAEPAAPELPIEPPAGEPSDAEQAAEGTGEESRDKTGEEPEAEEEEFQLELESVVTPELLSRMVAENAEFGKLLEADPKLKGQLYKTAREAAELRPYREIFPDVEAAQQAQAGHATWVDVRETFLGSTSREGTMASLNKIAELSYERDADGNVVIQNGRPVIGEDFFGFVDNVVGLDLEHRGAEVDERLKAGRYASQEERERDERVKAALETLREESAATSPASEALPESLQRKQEELDRRERALNERQHGEKVEERRSFESSLQNEAQQRIGDGIHRILANVEKQGGVISPYLKNILPKAIGAKLVRKIQANPTLQGQMQELQRLPIGDPSRQRRLAAIDRAVQQYLPDVAREELREAGVQVVNASAAKRAKIDAQIDSTKKTEPKGSTGPAGKGGAAMSSGAAFDHAQAEWQKANPGRPFDKVAKEAILPRVLQLMTSR